MTITKIDLMLCQGCKTCYEICPMDVIRWNDEELKPVIIYPEDCQLCELCVIECPEDAIIVTPEKDLGHILSWG
ncbi:MAG: ferredoxin family protein [Desulfobulbaceae bacterium]|uniref:Ferredoxin family protein n=1 Tax=Candidatus Desulfobia pelagia TaxID=2841692 RepID=A0A8J6NBY2_9BACT|nr:ferredoxin family protein [Candidatus Desulfobia pelagia]